MREKILDIVMAASIATVIGLVIFVVVVVSRRGTNLHYYTKGGTTTMECVGCESSVTFTVFITVGDELSALEHWHNCPNITSDKERK